MPKTRKHVGGHRRKPQPVRISHKIGGRKSTVSAVLLSTSELITRLGEQSDGKGKATRARDVAKIKRVLQNRGVTDFALTA